MFEFKSFIKLLSWCWAKKSKLFILSFLTVEFFCFVSMLFKCEVLTSSSWLLFTALTFLVVSRIFLRAWKWTFIFFISVQQVRNIEFEFMQWLYYVDSIKRLHEVFWTWDFCLYITNIEVFLVLIILTINTFSFRIKNDFYFLQAPLLYLHYVFYSTYSRFY